MISIYVADLLKNIFILFFYKLSLLYLFNTEIIEKIKLFGCL